MSTNKFYKSKKNRIIIKVIKNYKKYKSLFMGGLRPLSQSLVLLYNKKHYKKIYFFFDWLRP